MSKTVTCRSAWRLGCAAILISLASAVFAAEPETGTGQSGTAPTAQAPTTPAAPEAKDATPSGTEAPQATEPAKKDESAETPKDGEAEKPAASEAETPKEGGTESKSGESEKPAGTEAEKPKEGESSGNEEKGARDQESADNNNAAVRLKDLLAQGFLIRTTVFIPADAVSRQIGRLSTDAIVVTLQKENAIAVCYYAFRSYVRGGKSLARIPSCTTFQ